MARSRRLTEAPSEATKTQPVTYWAVLGGVTLAFILFIWGKWILGPNFKAVPSGRTSRRRG